MTRAPLPGKRWVTTWPFNLQPTFGSSMVDWTKVEVVPAYQYDELLHRANTLADAVQKLHGVGCVGIPVKTLREIEAAHDAYRAVSPLPEEDRT